MATTPEIDIEIQLSGAQKVDKQIDELTGGLEGLGETGSSLADTLGATNEKLGEGLENVGGAVGELKESFKSLGEGIAGLGDTGAKGFLALLGPIGQVVAAGVLVWETFKMITGAAQEAQEAEEAMNAASSDLQSKLEALAEKGIIPTTEELEKFSLAVIESQLAKEAFETAMTKYRKTFDKITQAKKNAADAAREEADAEKIGGYEYVQNVLKRQQADRDLIKSRAAASKAIHEFQKVQRDTLNELMAAAEQEQEFEKRSTDALKADAKKLANLQKEAALIRAKIANKGDELAQADDELTQKIKLLKLEEQLEDANHDQTVAILARIKSQGELNAIDVERLKAQQQQLEILKKEREEEKKARQERRKASEARRKQQEQEAKKQLMLSSQLKMMTIRQEQEGIDQALALESERHRLSVALTKQGTKERLIEEKRFQLAVQKAEQEKLNAIQEANLKELEIKHDLARRTLELQEDSSITDFGALQAEQEKRLSMLQLEYNQEELELARMKGEDLKAIEERFALDRLKLDQENLKERSELIDDYFDNYGKGFAEAAVGALLFGDSFQEATAEILKGLAQQAGVESLMSLAKGFAQIALGDPKAAASFKAAALFGTAAAVAGAAGSALSSSGGVGGAGATPTGTPTTAPTPQREEVRTDSMVFNINFGGAVVYDTKKAAEQALADRLVSIINTPRRGAPRINRR
jgi:hypothetical protein